MIQKLKMFVCHISYYLLHVDAIESTSFYIYSWTRTSQSIKVFRLHLHIYVHVYDTKRTWLRKYGRGCPMFRLLYHGYVSGADYQDHVDSIWALNGPLARYIKLRVAHATGMPGMFSPPPRVSDPDMHHGTLHGARAVMHVGIAN